MQLTLKCYAPVYSYDRLFQFVILGDCKHIDINVKTKQNQRRWVKEYMKVLGPWGTLYLILFPSNDR